MLDGIALLNKLNEWHRDWSKWYCPTETELKSADWQRPTKLANNKKNRA